MRHVKTFALFEAQKGLTKAQTEFLDRYAQGTWSLNPETGLVDVKGDFIYSNRGAKSFRGVRFGRVSGDFDCSSNILTSLEGAPQTVGGNFDCRNNRLTSLEGAPQTVNGKFSCSFNRLTSLEGAPQTVNGDFYCDFNNLTSLEGAPQTVGGNFDCRINNLTSLEGAPQTVGGDFRCAGNKLTSLEGAPQTVNGDFDCYDNRLTSLEGAPQIVDGNFKCNRNILTSLEGAPQTVSGDFSCDAFRIPRGKWNAKGWSEAAHENKRAAELLVPLFSEPQLDDWMSKNPLDLDLLDDFPEIKSGVLRRTGLRDLSRLGKSIRGNLI